MEIMHQQSSSPLDGRWRGHVPLPYAAHGTALPTSLHHLRQQQQQQQQQQRPLHHLHPQQQHLPQQQEQQLQLQQQLQQHNRHSLKQSRSQQSAEAGSSRGHPSSHPSSSSSSSSSHSVLASPQPSPDTPAQGKSGGAKEDVDKKEGVEWEQYNAGAAFLGPTLWDKTLSYDSDLKLEYMDLDEFLNENGIPIEASKVMARGSGGGGAPTGLAANTKSCGNTTGGSGGPEPTSPTASVNPEAASPSSPNCTPVGLGVVPQGPPHPAQPQGPSPATPAPPPPQSAPPPSLSPQSHLGDEYCSSDSGSPHSPALQVHEGVPGQDFDPRTRCFSEEELKPQPMIKKSRKQFVPVELKDEKYWARRRKNNMAAKRSRDARRLKENQIAMRANFLEKENDVLTTELQKAQAVVEALKKRLAVYEVV